MPTIFDKFSMTSKTAIITGGAGLLGKQFSLTLAQAGANVVVADLNQAAAQTQADFITSQGFKAEAVAVDVSDPQSINALVKHVKEQYGRVDVLVNSAAIDPKFDSTHIDGQVKNDFEHYPLAAWNASLNINLTGMFLMSQAVATPMLEQGRGVIINICSTYGLAGPDQRLYIIPGEPPKVKPVDYSVTKAGVLGFTRYLAAYYAGRNIRVNALTPGGVFNDHSTGFVNNYAARTIMGRMANIDEMNGAILFLASDASTYMTGSNLVVDGGWTAW